MQTVGYDTARLLGYLEDCISSLSNGASGIRLAQVDEEAQRDWTQNLLRMVFRLFEPRSQAVNVTWLRPLSDRDILEVAQSENLGEGARHYRYRLNEGLAGRVWFTGETASHHPAAPHRWWKERVGCENQSYVCAAVGQPQESGGVLGVGSDAGFAAHPEDERVVEIFAGLLSCAHQARPARPRPQLRREAQALRAVAEGERDRDLVSPELAGQFNQLLAEIRMKGKDPAIAAVEPVDPVSSESVAGLKRKLDRVERALRGR